MAEEMTQSVDIWSELEEANDAVEAWPHWQQQYEADVHYEALAGRQSEVSAGA